MKHPTKAQLAEQIKTLEAEVQRYKKLWQDSDKSLSRHLDTHSKEIEKHRAALESLLRVTVEIHELIVDARFDPSRLDDAFRKTREKILTIVTKDLVELATPKVTLNPLWLMGLVPMLAYQLYTSLKYGPDGK